jgi:hypothetical protein
LTFFDLEGKPLNEMRAPGLLFATPTSIHISEKNAKGWEQTPVVYHSTEDGGAILMYLDGKVTTLVSNANIFQLMGIPGSPILAYTTVEWQQNELVSQLFIDNIATLPAAGPVLKRADPEGWFVRPLAIRVVGDRPEGIWFTLSAWGIGGDIVFEPRKEFSYFDLATKETVNFFGTTISPWALSLDQTWTAYTSDWAGPMTIVHDMDNEQTIAFPLAAGSDRGAGNAVFSPDNRYIAWMEGSGYQMAEQPNLHLTIRIASTSGEISVELPDTVLSSVIGGKESQWIEPVGWLDERTLIIGVYYDNWEQSALVRISYDGSRMEFLAPGSFVSLLYP